MKKSDLERCYRMAATCRAKKVFGSEAEALAFPGAQFSYLCPHCGKWHLTSRRVSNNTAKRHRQLMRRFHERRTERARP